MMNRIIAVELPKAKTYGAVELTKLINKHTLRGVYAAIALTILLFLFVVISAMMQYQVYFSPITSISSVDLSVLTRPETTEVDQVDPVTAPDVQVNHGPASRAGNPVAVPDAEITADMAEFSAIDEIERAASVGGDGIDDGTLSANIDLGEVKEVEKIEEEPDIGAFIAVEQEPAVSNLNDLMKLVKYPDIARKAGIEGVVVVGVLVGPDGAPKKAQVVSSANSNLNQAAIDAALAYRGYTPAIQNEQPVSCWLMLPINFSLR